MERRTAKRIARRLRVILTDRATKSQQTGFTVNLSASGMLVAVTRPPRVGARVRVEVFDQKQGVAIEAVVARISHGKALDDEAVGLRFLSPVEVLREIAPAIEDPAQAAEAPRAIPATAPPEDSAPPPAAQPPLDPDDAPVLESPLDALFPGGQPPPVTAPPAREPPPEASAAAREAGDEPRPPQARPGPYRVVIEDAETLRRRYEQEIRYGGLFIADPDPPRLNQPLILEITLAGGGGAALRAAARVVQRVSHGTPGFAVEFHHREEVIRAVAALLRLPSA